MHETDHAVPAPFELKSFAELTTAELYAILRVRAAVFVVEQHCPYQDVDGLDEASLHLFAWNADHTELVAYLRIMPAGVAYPGAVGIGRVLTDGERGTGLGGRLLRAAVAAIDDIYDHPIIRLAAQQHATGFYAREGFVPCSEPFDEDGIPHVEMIRPATQSAATQSAATQSVVA
ncbi:GNAT family N-acetyltransferase [Bifidobacterium choloepi]|uniref:GNAT family N-acetyltransferase n=1 Tax=Bifidobacterium choloepi TaxID=2614131 RepID=A0A6I5NCK5_9BIFI|nr:GNAT family N-acetyltransferase [Bifidobacterium choloepi]NEG69204.1 GNAT family N-acetyltransferase [Bifidobacterium choloepi]